MAFAASRKEVIQRAPRTSLKKRQMQADAFKRKRKTAQCNLSQQHKRKGVMLNTKKGERYIPHTRDGGFG